MWMTNSHLYEQTLSSFCQSIPSRNSYYYRYTFTLLSLHMGIVKICIIFVHTAVSFSIRSQFVSTCTEGEMCLTVRHCTVRTWCLRFSRNSLSFLNTAVSPAYTVDEKSKHWMLWACRLISHKAFHGTYTLHYHVHYQNLLVVAHAL